MDTAKAKEEIDRLEQESKQHQAIFVQLMGGLADGSSTIDETCLAFRKFSTLKIDAFEWRLRILGEAIQAASIDDIDGLLNELRRSLPTIG